MIREEVAVADTTELLDEAMIDPVTGGGSSIRWILRSGCSRRRGDRA